MSRRDRTSTAATPGGLQRDLSPRAAVAWCLGILAGAFAVRLVPCFGDFWLDEIWTYGVVRRFSSAADVFTRFHHSNNHHLNTLIFYWLGDRAAWAVYRVPSLLAGVGTVALAAASGWRRSRLEAVFAAALTGSCFALIHFSSEARGYALAVFFSLSAFLALERYLEQERLASAALFGAGAVLGFLSHLVFLFVYAGALGISLWELRSRHRSGARALRSFLRLHAPPALALGLLYWVDLRHMKLASGISTALDWVLARTFGFAFGLPVSEALALPYALLAGALFAYGLRTLWSEGSRWWLFFLIVIAAAPALAVAAVRPDVLAVRYFLIPVTFLLLLTAHLLAREFRSGGIARAASLLLLGVFLAGNARHTAVFLERGRGGYLDALLFMAEHTEGPRIVAGSDHDLRNGMVLRFYARHLPPGKNLIYTPQHRLPTRGPDWWVVHHQTRPADPPLALRVGAQGPFTLAAEFDHGAISGFYWAVYRREAPAPARDPAATPDDSPASARRRIRSMPNPRRPKGSAPMRSTRS